MSEAPAPRVQRVDHPTPELLALTTHGPAGREVLLLGCARSSATAGLVPERPRGRPVSAFGRRLRTDLVGARLVAVRGGRDAFAAWFTRGDESRTLVAVARRDVHGFALLDGTGRRLAATGAFDVPPLDALAVVDDVALRHVGPTIAASQAHAALEGQRADLARALGKARARLARRRLAVEADAARITDVERLREEASLLLGHAQDDRAGRAALEVDDWTTDPPSRRTIALDPSQGLRAQAQQRFHRARRLERGAAIAEARWADTVAAEERLDDLLSRLHEATSPELVESIADEVRAAGLEPEPRARSGSRAGVAPRVPYRRYRSERGLEIRVGKTARDNDALTLGVARPHDLFVHVRGVPGSHVIVALDRGASCDPETLLDAATLAAHFSGERGQARVEIQYAERRHVHKRRGAAEGAVVLSREKVLMLRFEHARLARLLAAELGA